MGNEEKVEVTIDEFNKMGLTVGKVLEVEKVEGSKKLLKLVVDIGREKRTVVAGIAGYYQPEELLGKCVIVVANLKPARLLGVESQGMILAADVDGRPIIATFEEDVPAGAPVR